MAAAVPPRRAVIVGAGPAGLVTLKTLLHQPSDNVNGDRPFDPIVLDFASSIGGTFDQRSYENGELVSSKQLTAFSDYRFPASTPDHVSLLDYVKYLKGYVVRFGLDYKSGKLWDGTPFERKSRIQLGVRVVRVDKVDGLHRVTFQRGQGPIEYVDTPILSLCTGLHVLPSVPNIPGLSSNLVPQSPPIQSLPDLPSTPPENASKEKINWKVKEGVRAIHSSQYKFRDEFKDRRVLILGLGETSMDLSYEAIQAGAKEVVVCHRGGFLSFPKVLNDFQVFGIRFDGKLPIDGLITNLFETAYVHPWMAASHIRWFISDFVIKRVLWFLTGTQAGCNQWVGELPPERLGRAYVFLNKSIRALPYINRPYQPESRFLSTYLKTFYIDPPLTHVPGRASTIDLAMWPSSVDTKGNVHFSSSSSLPQSGKVQRKEEVRMRDRDFKPDLVVFATGYRTEFGWLGDEYRVSEGRDVREVCRSDDLSVGWIGFVRPGVGAIPPIAEQQAMFWTLLLLGKIPTPTSKPHYKLLVSEKARIQHGVDHSSYMSTLAKDMGSAPSLKDLWQHYGLKVLVCYCFGAAFTVFYRLEGPFAAPEMMKEIVENELWETITRRGVAGNLFMGVIPMAFYCFVNLIAFILEKWLTSVIVPLVACVGLGGVLPAILTSSRGNTMRSPRNKEKVY
ncbi:hypothetical protein T439DRAFT_308852 [Meredithblackwellia eburnea MCA 4105]